MRFHPVIFLIGTSLAACSSHVNVELGTSDVDGVSSVTVLLEGVDLLDEDGELHSLDVDTDDPIELRSLLDGQTLTLIDRAEIEATRYVGLRLRLADSGNVVILDDGSEAGLAPDSVGSFADIDFDISDDETATLVSTLDLRFSLHYDNDTGDYTLVQHLRGVAADLASSISGTIPASDVEGSTCRQGREIAAGVAVYLFDRESDALVDYQAGYSGPIASARVQATGDRYAYQLPYVDAGDYTLAWTCQADRDSPSSDDDVEFESSTEVSLDSGESKSVDF